MKNFFFFMASLLAVPINTWGQQLVVKAVTPTSISLGVGGDTSGVRSFLIFSVPHFTAREPSASGWFANPDSIWVCRRVSDDPLYPLYPASCYLFKLWVQVDTLIMGQVFQVVQEPASLEVRTAPIAPWPLQYTEIQDSSVVVRWDHTPNARMDGWCDEPPVEYLVIDRYSSFSSGWLESSNLPVEKSLVVNGLVPGSTHEFLVKARNKDGVESAQLSLGVVTTLRSSVADAGGFSKSFTLEQNYPNPFNPETTIRYQLPVAGHVRMSIYTVLGQEVRRLIDRSQAAAYHVVAWDGRDNAGNTLPSGVYFYRLESGGFTAMKKMMMVR